MAEKEIQIVYTVPNQKVVKVKHDICDKAHPYTMCNVKSNSKALKELSPNTYKLYMYFDLNQDGYTFALSYQAVHNATGMSDKTYQKAVRELIEKKYLVPSKTKGLYIFYDGTIDSEDRKVEITQQEELILPTESKKDDVQKVKNGSSRKEETTGEIIQDNTFNNTIYTNDNSPDGSQEIDRKKLLRFKDFDDETKEEMMEMLFAGGNSFKLIADTFDTSVHVVTKIRKEYLKKQENKDCESNENKVLDITLTNGKMYSRTKDELFNDATDNGKSLVEDVAWTSLENSYIMMDIPPFTAKQLIKEFQQKLKDLNDMAVLEKASK